MPPASNRARPGVSRSRGQSADPRRELGARGEQLAATHLRQLGYDIVARNVRTRHGEIDLIAADPCALVLVEVKTRRMGARQRAVRVEQNPLHRLGARQRARLRRLAAAWLAESRHPRPRPPAIRFDAIGVLIDSHDRLRHVEHLEGAW